MKPPLSSTAAGPARDVEMFAAGQAAARLGRDCWCPVPLRWRHVLPGDVVLDPDRRSWMLTDRPMSGGLTVTRGAHSYTATPDPDAVVDVLVPVAEREAVEVARDQLGAALVARRTA